MANEATKLRERWQREGIWDKYIHGDILDIGCGADKISPEARGWDQENGDGNGQILSSIAGESFDVVFSSHFLEHVADPLEALLNQWRVLRPDGYLIFLVPDEDLYEQGIWPSTFNNDHKHTFTISKHRSWSPASRNLVDLVRYLPEHKVVSMRIVDTNYDHETTKIRDQSETAEVCVEVIIQKVVVQLQHQHALNRAFFCPRCKRMEFIIRGVNTDGHFDCYCKHCGVSGSLKENA